jgi:hypothetical protein
MHIVGGIRGALLCHLPAAAGFAHLDFCFGTFGRVQKLKELFRLPVVKPAYLASITSSGVTPREPCLRVQSTLEGLREALFDFL